VIPKELKMETTRKKFAYEEVISFIHELSQIMKNQDNIKYEKI